MIFINLHIGEYRLVNLCAALGVSRRTYYRHRSGEDPDYYDYVLIKEVFDESKGTYGYRRIQEGLRRKYGAAYNHKKIQRIMGKYGLRPEYIRRIRPSVAHKRIEENVRPNLVRRRFETGGRNRVWCTDVTYLIFGNRRAYLSTIIDLYDRRVVAYRISKSNDLKIVMDTLGEAFRKEKDVNGLIIHSDQGFQYTSFQYKAVCSSKGVLISMSRKGTPIDDSPIESWHGILKKETLYNNDISSLEHYIQLVEEWIEFYNTTRIKNRNL